MRSRLTLTAVFEPVEDGWVQARILELPAVITAGASQEEAEELLVDAVAEYLRSLGPDEDVVVSSSARRVPLEVVVGADA